MIIWNLTFIDIVDPSELILVSWENSTSLFFWSSVCCGLRANTFEKTLAPARLHTWNQNQVSLERQWGNAPVFLFKRTMTVLKESM